MQGLQIRGSLVAIDLPESGTDFANVTVETRRSNGEPRWMRAGFPVTAQGTDRPTPMATQLQACKVGDQVAVAVDVRQSKAGRLWTKAFAIEVLDAAPSAQERKLAAAKSA